MRILKSMLFYKCVMCVLLCSLHAFSVQCARSSASLQRNQHIIPSFKVQIQLLLTTGENSNESWSVVYSAMAVSYDPKMFIKFTLAGLIVMKVEYKIGIPFQ
jgi:hypothetical protein